MSYVSDALLRMRHGDYDSAAKILESHLTDEGLRANSKLSLIEWIADCYNKAEERREAGKWFELAAKSALECNDLGGVQRKRKAAYELERARECYFATNNYEGIRRVSLMRYSLNPARS